MKNLIFTALLGICSMVLFISESVWAKSAKSNYGANTSETSYGYGKTLCKQAGFYCIRTKRGDTWERLWPDYQQQMIVKYVNRMNISLQRGVTLAVPDNLESIDIIDVAPFPRYRDPTGHKVVIVDQSVLAWGAYDEAGNLVNWAPISAGRGYCPDVKRGCHTVTGSFAFYGKQGANCVSKKFPIGKGGAKMPYCMFFYKGFALHGSYEVPGYNASHGCVRTFVNAAQWLNEEFIELPNHENGYAKTQVIVH